jgi:AraC-like DNA-binding protein
MVPCRPRSEVRLPFAQHVGRGQPGDVDTTNWRMALAADLLRSRDATIAAVARQVGYSKPFALGSAFKRAYGVSPNAHSAAALAV